APAPVDCVVPPALDVAPVAPPVAAVVPAPVAVDPLVPDALEVAAEPVANFGALLSSEQPRAARPIAARPIHFDIRSSIEGGTLTRSRARRGEDDRTTFRAGRTWR